MSRLAALSEMAPETLPLRSSGRYYASFYKSFSIRHGECSSTSLMRDLVEYEGELRFQIVANEQEELVRIVSIFEAPFSLGALNLMQQHSLPVDQEERVCRWRILHEYYQMLLEASIVEELLSRRHVEYNLEPTARRQTQGCEADDWIESRKIQLLRMKNEYEETQNRERALRIAYFEWKLQQEYQLFLFEQSEKSDRLEVERQQRLNAGILAGLYNNEFRVANYHQLRYALLRQSLSAEVCREIVAAEARERTFLFCEEVNTFKRIRAAECRSYLTCSRHSLINSSAEHRI